MASSVRSPFVSFRQYATKEVGSTPTLVFGQDSTCVLSGGLVCNQTGNDIEFFMRLLREEAPETAGGGESHSAVTREAVEYPLFVGQPIKAYGSFLLPFKDFIMEAGDTLHASSDHEMNRFNIFISYEKIHAK